MNLDENCFVSSKISSLRPRSESVADQVLPDESKTTAGPAKASGTLR